MLMAMYVRLLFEALKGEGQEFGLARREGGGLFGGHGGVCQSQGITVERVDGSGSMCRCLVVHDWKRKSRRRSLSEVKRGSPGRYTFHMQPNDLKRRTDRLKHTGNAPR